MRTLLISAGIFLATAAQSQTVTLTAFGDAAGIRGFGQHGEWPAGQVARQLQGVEVLKSDVNFVNVEASLTRTCQRYMQKSFPFSMGPKTLHQFAAWGFNLFGLANNHTIDCLSPYPAGESVRVQGIVQREFPAIRFHGIASSLNRMQKPAVMQVNGLRLGMVAVKGWANPRSWPLASLQNRDLVLRALQSAAVDVRILSLHGGEENSRIPTPLMREVAREFVTQYDGDVVLAHHSHSMQGYELVAKPNGRHAVIFYSLGNFLHNGLSKRGDGMAVKLTLDRSGVRESQIIPLAHASSAPRPAAKLSVLRGVLQTNHRHLSSHPWPAGFVAKRPDEIQARSPYPHLRLRWERMQVKSPRQRLGIPREIQVPAAHSLPGFP